MFGQMSIRGLSQKADYLQLDICGLETDDILKKYNSYNKDSLPIPVILHGDWTKKGFSENNIVNRYPFYIQAIEALKEKTEILGLTIHPPLKSKVPLARFLILCDRVQSITRVPVLIENRSNSRLWVSEPEWIPAFSENHLMTIDIPQLYIACGYNLVHFLETLERIHWNNIKELHLGNVVRKEKNTFVARKIEDGLLDYSLLIPYLKVVEKKTLEILGGIKVFEQQVDYLGRIINEREK